MTHDETSFMSVVTDTRIVEERYDCQQFILRAYLSATYFIALSGILPALQMGVPAFTQGPNTSRRRSSRAMPAVSGIEYSRKDVQVFGRDGPLSRRKD
jgi:hypothetical protein